MQNGIIKNYNIEKGFGFIEVRGQDEDVFFHISIWQSQGVPTVGTAVSFDSERSQKGLRATRVVAQTSKSQPFDSHAPASKAQQNKPSKHTNSNTKVKKNWLSSVISALIILAAIFFGGSELLSSKDNTQQNSATPDSTISTGSDVPVITGDAQIDSTIALIKQGGPYPYPEKDGTTFYNREGRLPKQPRGYYREYTVPTPGVSHRGPRRIVTGGNPPTYYYLTVDHYDSFRQLEVQ